MSTMVTREYTVRFLTPAFLGDAHQDGAWRTPPFKALLRQWWRVAVARRFDFDHQAIREEEGRLFGNTWLESSREEKLRGIDNHHSKSLVRLRLSQWTSGTQKGVAPERDSLEMKYVAWGLIGRGAGVSDRTALKDRAGSSAEAQGVLSLAFPAAEAPDLDTTLALIHHFGTLGSRCRNGWGSFSMEGTHPSPMGLAEAHSRDLNECLKHPWPASLARNESGALVWESTRDFETWGRAMLAISTTKKELRRVLPLDPKSLSERHILGLPVKDSDPVGDKDARMPSPVRFKVILRNERLAYRVIAMPHALPDAEGLDSERLKPGKSRAGLRRADFDAMARRAWPQAIRRLSDTAVSGVRLLSAS